jgi:uncharacterized protein (TIGR03437 family)
VRHIADPAPLVFEENLGQADATARYLVRGAPAFFTADSFVLTPDRIAFRFLNPAPAPSLQTETPYPVSVNVLRGSNPEQWRRNIPTARSIVYRSIYNGVDAAFRSDAAGLTLQLRLAGASLEAIAFEVTGARAISVAATGALNVIGSLVLFQLGPPDAFQQIGGQRVPVTARFAVDGNRVTLTAGNYNRNEALLIDCKLPGGASLVPFPSAAATDAEGNLYIASSVTAVPVEPFPANVCARGDLSNAILCADALVAKLDPTGEPVWITYLQGSNHDAAQGLAIDAGGRVYTAGSTFSSDFPVTAGAFQTTNAGPVDQVQRRNLFPGGDLYVARLDPQTGLPVYSSFIGGPESEVLLDLAVDSRGAAYLLTGARAGLPVTPGAWRRTPQAIDASAAIAVAPSGASLLFATYLPGAHNAIAAAPGGTVLVAGNGYSPLPVTPNAIQRASGGNGDAYLVHLDSGGTQPLLATYWGGASMEGATDVAVDPNGVAWIAGSVDRGGFLLRLDLAPARVLSTHTLHRGALIPDPQGGFFLSGAAEQPNLETTPDALVPGGCAAFTHPLLSRFNPGGTLTFRSYLEQVPNAAVAWPNGDVLLLSQSGIDRIEWAAATAPDLACIVDAAGRDNRRGVAAGQIVTLLGSQIGPAEPRNAAPEGGRFPFTLGETRVLFDGLPAPLLYAGSGQINAIVPWAIEGRERVKVEVERSGRVTTMAEMAMDQPRFSLFTADGIGFGQAAALNQDGTLNSAQNPAASGSIVVLYGTGGGPLTPRPEDGALAPLELIHRPVLTIEAVIPGPAPCEVLYAGPAPTLVFGLWQVNCRLPAQLPEFVGLEVPISVRVNGRTNLGHSPTIAVR